MPGGAQIGGGVAGVASTSEQESVMVYNERHKFNEWEFIYDFTKDRRMVGAAGQGMVGTPASQLGQAAGTGAQNPSQSGFGSGFGLPPSTFGSAPASGQSGFGQSGFGQPTSPPSPPPPRP
jgi:hypothetical protein